jgi:hypothetical protein
MLGEVRLFDAELFLYGAGGEFAFAQRFHDRYPSGV